MPRYRMLSVVAHLVRRCEQRYEVHRHGHEHWRLPLDHEYAGRDQHDAKRGAEAGKGRDGRQHCVATLLFNVAVRCVP
jgi:hypothetical protein